MQRRKRSRSTSRRPTDRIELVVDACLVLCLFAVPLWFGGKHDLGRLLYSATVGVAAIAWGLRCWRRGESFTTPTIAHTLLLAAVALVGLQLIPWSPGVLRAVSPGLAELAPSWFASAESAVRLGEWRTVSVTPSATRIGLAVLISHALLFTIAVERLRELPDITRLLRAIAAASAVMAVLGLLQWLTGSDKLLWSYAHPWPTSGRVVRGAFTNRNHFAHYVVLGVGPMVMALLAAYAASRATGKRRSQRPRRPIEPMLWSAALVLAIGAVFFTLSRGGVVALATAGVVACVVLLRGRRLNRAGLFGVAGVAATALLLISFGDTDRLFGRFDDLASGSVDELDKGGSRRAIWSANLAALRANPWLGYGVGSHADVYPAFIETPNAKEYTHAESGYLHTTTQTGLAGGVLALGAILLVVGWCLRGVLAERDNDRLAAWAAVSAGLAASFVHSIVDVVWYVPSCMGVTLLLAACALRLYQTRETGQSASVVSHASPTRPASGSLSWFGTPAAIGATALAVVSPALLWGPARGSLAWDRYLRTSVSLRSLTANQTSDAESEDAQRDRDMAAFLKRRMIAALEEVLHHHPSHARAHLRLASRRLREFEAAQRDDPDAIGLIHLRDAALASRFPSRRATEEWLSRAVGEEAALLGASYDHARRALALAPLQGDGYTLLADLAFLSAPGMRDLDGLLGQALRLRPLDGGVVFEAGKHALIAGDADGALTHWKHAHQLPGAHQERIIYQLAGQMPASTYLEEFRPDWKALVAIRRRYLPKNDPADLQAIADYAKRLAEQPAEDPRSIRRRCKAWLLASRIEQELEHPEEGVRCAELAMATLPKDYAARWCVASAYMAADRHEDAAPHLRWCLSRKPNDKSVAEWLKETKRRRLAARFREEPPQR